MRWDGDDGNPDVTDFTGLNSLDLTENGINDRFVFEGRSEQAAAQATFTVYQSELVFAQASVTLPVVEETLEILFQDFTPSDGSFSFSNVGAIVLEIEPANGISSFEGALDDVRVAGVPGSIHGFKFEDLDGDGQYEPDQGDDGLGGVTFQLLDEDGLVVDMQSSGPDGQFWFVDLVPGTYTVRELDDPFDDVVPTTPLDVEVTVLSGQELVWQEGAAMLDPEAPQEEVLAPELIWGNYITGSIHGFKFEDINGNGQYEPDQGEGGLGGVMFLLLDEAGQPVDIQESDPNGRFWFVDLAPGNYTVSELDDPFDFAVPTTPLDVQVTVLSGQELVWQPGEAMLGPEALQEEVLTPELIWGNQTTITGSIHGFKFEDSDGDGQYEPDQGDDGLGGVTFQLLNESGQVVDMQDSGPDGQFWFVDLVPGIYTVRELDDPFDDVVPTTPLDVEVTVLSGQEL
ncbi:MAG: hypothetical protein GTO62_00945, partial [Planctomycetales bacterium]|nr:hypothetical protein [Planctomycetales bacterium]NIP67789.1 hypothetical protein [Planctomycetales bacterium]